jgi:hypothetical protein
MTHRPRRVVAALILATTATLGLAGCQTPAPTTPANAPVTCDAGWVCAPGTNQCAANWVCGTCPHGGWSYLNDGSASARAAQTNPPLIPVIDPRKPCG